ncbi:MAG: histidinol-phosphatase HisJ family protein [bacterium]|nr:histidinol-phosphatase HisJ family protein [bacterium]
MRSDCHLHSSHSGDSDAPMEDMIRQGISLGLSAMCFTEHQDIAYPDAPGEPGSIFLLDTDSYLRELTRLREKYRGRIRLLFGVELGLQPGIVPENTACTRSHAFDFIIGSTHICRGRDPYLPSFFEGRAEEEAYLEYFEEVLENIRLFSDFDVLGHLDYVVRYGPNRDARYSYAGYREILDAILKMLLKKGKGLELNTGGIKKGMKDFHPCQDILKRYRELGGEIVTVGSDSHDTLHIADSFDRAAGVLRECGFRYYTVFEKRVPAFLPLT